MVASWEKVILAEFAFWAVFVVSCDDSFILIEWPGGFWITSVASISTGFTTGEDIFRWDSGLEFLVWVNTDSVTHGFGSSESPTRSASCLISDFFNRIAVCPSSSGIESFWKWTQSQEFVAAGSLLWKSEVFWSLQGSHLSFNEVEALIFESGVVSGDPTFLVAVNEVNHFLGEWGWFLGQ